MFDVQPAADLLSSGVNLLRNHVPPERWPNPILWSALAIPMGLLSALWGARLLRVVYVLAFMVIGAAVGFRVAEAHQIDRLIGFILGAGFAGLIGYLLFRLWLGATAGACAVLLMAVVTAPHLSAVIQDFDNHRLGVSTGEYTLAQPAGSAPNGSYAESRQYLTEMKDYLWKNRPELVYKGGFLVALVWLLGLTLGAVLPRLTMVIATSLIGVASLAIGAGYLLAMRWPDAWIAAKAHPLGLLGGLALLLLVSVSFQLRSRRIVSPPPAPATA